jgi:ABC-2 type transport system ATP-binding protein
VFVRTPDGPLLRRVLAADGVEVANAPDTADGYDVTGIDAGDIGRRTAGAGLVLYELTPVSANLESTFMALTHDAVQYQAHSGATAASNPAPTIPDPTFPRPTHTDLEAA